MHLDQLKSLYKSHKELQLRKRYICTKHILKSLNNKSSIFRKEVIGKSVCEKNIYSITIGSGKKKILIWSQMHGNESTTTKAIFDLLNVLSHKNQISESIINACTIKIIPILNPDGAKAYTRLNANQIDLNRDAQNLSQPESIALNACFHNFKPDFCFNLHGQRTIFSAGKINNPATISFLAPAQDVDCLITSNRKKAMEIITVMNAMLQKQIPDQIGIYDDAFNINCVGDTFQAFNTPTILFEAGHYKNDYQREQVREFIFQSLIVSLDYIANNNISGDNFKAYLDIPKNEKLFFDIIIRNVKLDGKDALIDIAIQYEEILNDETINFRPKVEKFININQFFAHHEFDANGSPIFTHNNEPIFEGYSNDFVIMNNEELSLSLAKSSFLI